MMSGDKERVCVWGGDTYLNPERERRHGKSIKHEIVSPHQTGKSILNGISQGDATATFGECDCFAYSRVGIARDLSALISTLWNFR